MKTEKEIQERINKIKTDERLYYKPASVFENAPLALIQFGLEMELHTLEEVLGLPLSRFPLQKENKQSDEKATC